MPSTAQFSLIALVTESLTYVTGTSGLQRVARTVKEMDYATPETTDLLREIYRARQEDIRKKSEDTEAEETAPG
jgi:hypothetical protein